MSRSIFIIGLSLAAALSAACKSGSDTPPANSTAAPAPPAAAATPEIDPTKPLPDPLPDVVAKVNGQAVHLHFVKSMAESAIEQQKIPAEQRPGVYRRAMNHFIVRELLLGEAMARGIKADQKKMEAAENESRAPYPDPKAFAAFLKSQGMDEEMFKTELRRQFTVNALLQQESDKFKPESITDEELKQFYDQHREEFTVVGRVRAAHIFVRVPPNVDPSRRGVFQTKAESLLAQVKGGADFAAVAKKSSDDVASRAKGGEMDVFAKGQLPPELSALEDAVQRLQPGQVSDVVETRAGLHIVKLLERLPDEVASLESSKDALRHHLVQRKRGENLQALIASLRAKAKIETYI